ncbi:MAG: L-threonylcarbamoyladenylate synthase [bacterium]|nr:L-threonylcarbamoyladenylate synthase [bacterium]
MKQIILDESNFEATVDETVCAAQAGELLLFPTDTVYGLGGKAFSRQVLDKLRQIKPEREQKPTAVLIDNIIRMSQCASDVPSRRIVALTEAFWPGPLTLVWKLSQVVPQEFHPPDDSLGYRMPKSDFLLEVLRRLEAPLWATSANLPGHPPPKLFSEIHSSILEASDVVIQARTLLSGKSSTVVDVRGREPILIRESGIREEDIKRVWRHA